MSDCPPVLVAQAIAAEIKAATWSRPVEVVLSWSDFTEELEFINDGGVLVDVVPNAAPTLDMPGTGALSHDIKTMIALRRRITREQRSSEDGPIPFDEVVPLVNLYYEMCRWFMPSDTQPAGRRLTTLPMAASIPPFEVVQLFDLAALKTGLYVGIMRTAYRYTEGSP